MEEGTPPGASNALKQTFNEFDKDRSGKIDKGELKSALQSLGIAPSDAQLTQLIQQVDVNKDGQVDFTEFVQLACENHQSRPTLHRPETCCAHRSGPLSCMHARTSRPAPDTGEH